MLKRKNVLSIVLAFLLILPSTMVVAQEVLPEVQPDLMGTGLSIPDRDASVWALDELVDSDRYGIYRPEDLYKTNLRNLLDDKLKESLLKEFKEKLEATNLEQIEKPEFLTEIKNSKTRGGFLREVYNILVSYENNENLGKDPIMYLNHLGIVKGNGKDLFLDRNITIEEGILFTKRAVDYIYSEYNLDSKGLMWKVENNGNTVYLLGAIHYGEPEIYPFRKEILKNFSASDALYVEVDISNEEELMKIMIEKFSEMEEELKKDSEYADGTTLDSVIDEELYSKIEVIMKKYDIPEEEYKNLKIQGIDQKLNEIVIEEMFGKIMDEDQAAFEETLGEDFEKELEESMEELFDNELMNLLMEGPKLGIDFYFLDKAKTLNKEIGELESMESQMELLFGGGLFGDLTENLTEEDRIKSLKLALENFDDEGNIIEVDEPENEEEFDFDQDFEAEMETLLQEQLDVIEGMFDAIKLGNADKLSKIFAEQEGAEIFGGELIGERDKNMAKKIGDLLQGEEEKTYFIVVGAAHFVVEGTILDNLTDLGYEVERIKWNLVE